MNRLLFSPALCCAVLMFGVAGCTPKDDKAPKPKTTASAPVGPLPKLGPAPAWTLKDINGAVISSDELKGKVVVVDFWATWCGPCGMEIPGYVELQNKYGKDGFTVVGLSIDDGGVDLVKDFVAKNHINYPVAIADEAAQTAFGGMEAIPTTFLIDRDGQVRDKKVGAVEPEEYAQRVAAVLRETGGKTAD